MKIAFYGKSTCSTCRDAKKLLKERGVAFDERDTGKKPLLPEETLAIVRAAGSVASVLNTRHAIAKERGWKETAPDPDVFATEVAKEPNLLRRPIVVTGGRAIVGFDRDAYDGLSPGR